MRRIFLSRSDRRVLGIVLVVLLFLLSACGANVGAAPSLEATATPATQHCGTVQTMGQLKVPEEQNLARSAEGCFWLAYQQCLPATLVYSQFGVDSGVIHTFSLKSQNGKCTVTDALQSVILPHSPKPVGTYTCTGLTQQSDGLHFLACSAEGDVRVPA